MLRSYEWLIGDRYLRGTRGRGFLSFISVVSVLGLAVGVAVLIVVLSVMNGFARELETRILSVTAHAWMTALDGNLVQWQRDQAQALQAARRGGGGAVHRGAGAAGAWRAYRRHHDPRSAAAGGAPYGRTGGSHPRAAASTI